MIQTCLVILITRRRLSTEADNLVPTRAEKNEKLTSSNFLASSSIFDKKLVRTSRCWASRQARKPFDRSLIAPSSSFVLVPGLSTDYPTRRKFRSYQRFPNISFPKHLRLRGSKKEQALRENRMIHLVRLPAVRFTPNTHVIS
jgi:hypothetical protein